MCARALGSVIAGSVTPPVVRIPTVSCARPSRLCSLQSRSYFSSTSRTCSFTCPIFSGGSRLCSRSLMWFYHMLPPKSAATFAPSLISNVFAFSSPSRRFGFVLADKESIFSSCFPMLVTSRRIRLWCWSFALSFSRCAFSLDACGRGSSSLHGRGWRRGRTPVGQFPCCACGLHCGQPYTLLRCYGGG